MPEPDAGRLPFSAAQKIPIYILKHGEGNFNIFYVLDDDLKVKFIIAEDELIEGLKIYGNISLEEYYGKKEKFSN